MAIRFDKLELAGSTNHAFPTLDGLSHGTNVRIQTQHGATTIGAGNTSYSHFTTDRASFYFNAAISFDGDLNAYGGTENIQSFNNVDAAKFRDKSNTAYYLDPAETGTALNVAGTGTFLGTGTSSFGGDLRMLSGTSGTTAKLIFKRTDNASVATYIRTNAYWNEYSSHQNEGHKFVDSNSSGTVQNILLQLNGDSSTTGNGALSATFRGDIYRLFKFGGVYFTWDSDSYGTNFEHSLTSSYGGSFNDSITLNSFNHIRFNIDSNNNNGTSYFEVGDGTTGTGNVIMRLDNNGHFYAEGKVMGDYFVGTDYSTDGYTVYKGYDNWNHFISIRGHARPGQSKAQAAILGGHQTSFVEYAENNSTTGWFFIGSAGTTYEEIAKITKTGSTFSGTVTATSFSGNGSNLTNVSATDSTKLPLAGGTMTGTLNAKTVQTRNTFPEAHNSYDLGTTGVRYRNVYAVNLYGDGSNITGISASDNTKLPLAGGTMTGTIDSHRNDTQTILLSGNSSASNADQFKINHSYGNVEIRNVRGNLNLYPTSTVNLGYGTSIKLATTSSGVSVTGNVQASNVIGNLATGTNGQQMEYGDTAKTTLRFDADRWRLYAGAGSGEVFTVEQNGEVGIKDSSPSYELDVNGDIRATGDVIAFSDERVKENIVTIDNALDKVTKLRGVQFNKIGEDKKSVGVIAQEVLKVLPEVVAHDDRDMYSVAYGNMVGVLIEAIKELNAEVKDLKEKLNK